MRKRTKSNKKLTPQENFSIGDSVVVNPGILDPDYGIDIGGWQGRITENDITDEQDNPMVTIAWDSITLKQMPVEIIERSEEDGLDWSLMGLCVSEVMSASPRDNIHQVEQVKDEIEDAHEMDYLGEQGRRMQQVLNSAGRKSELGRFKAWGKYLKEKLTFPFDAEVSEWQERGPIRIGDHVTVLGIGMVDGSYGIVVPIKTKRGHYDFPLCDLEALPDTSPNYQPLNDYVVWFANR